MTIAKSFAAKASVAFVAAAMILSMIAPAAQAQSNEDLQTMINTLLAQIASLQSQVGQGGTSVASGVCPYTWTRDLKVGATGGDVMKLQQFLNADADTRVSASGVGSVGMETEYYGPATAAAVSKFQVKYRAETLSPAGLVNPTGYFGPASRAKANAVCSTSVTPVDPVDPVDPTDPTEPENPSDLSGEADLDVLTVDSAEDDTIEEGAEDAPVAEITAQFVDGDASISRIDVQFASGDATDMWDVLDTVTLWVDGDMVAEEDASDADNYLGDEDDGIIRFSGLDLVGMEDEDLDIVVAVSLQNNLDAGDLQSYNVQVDAIRFFDADGVATTDDTTDEIGTNVAFTVEEAGTDDEIVVKASTNDPDATTLKVEDNQKSDWYTVFAFDLDTDDSVSDIEINEVPVTVTVSSSTYNTIVDDAELVIDGVTIDDFDLVAGTTSTAVLTFNVNGDVTVEAGDRVEAELKLRFKSLVSGNEGTTVQGSVTAGNRNAIDAEGSDTLAGAQLQGAATGDAHTLRTQGVAVTLDTDTAVVTQGDNAGDDYATFKLVVEITAFDQDVFINTDESVSASSSVVNSSGNVVAGTSTVVIDSSADVEGSSFKISEGETETVTITVTFDATTAGAAARLQLNALIFGETDTADNQTWMALPATDYRTDIVTLVN